VAYDALHQDVILFGGKDALGYPDDTWLLNGSFWQEVFPSASPPARSGGSMVYDAATQSVLLFGGGNSTGGLGDTWSWDGAAWTQLHPATSPSPRSDASAVYDDAQGEVILFGGMDVSGTIQYQDTWAWDGTNWTQLSPATSPPAREGAAFAYDAATQSAVLFGGASLSAPSVLGDTWLWNGATWAAATPAQAPTARGYSAAAYDAQSQTVVLFSGSYAGQVLTDTWIWNGTTWALATNQGPPARFGAAMAYDAATGLLVLFGGQPEGSQAGPPLYNDTWLWNSVKWSLATLGPADRTGASEVYDPLHHQVILFGGDAGPGHASRAMNDTWAWDGISWTQFHPATSPPARANASMVFDAATGTILLFGGGSFCCYNPAPLNDTWVWDGANWHQVFPATAPPPRYGAGAAYDAAHQQVVLFGGNMLTGNTFNVLGDTWTWDGANWTQQPTSTAPSARMLASMAYDPASATTVLFGGCGQSCGSNQLADTWTWNGTSWTQQTPAQSPLRRDAAALTFDDAHEALVLFGGEVGGNCEFSCPQLGDTWTWNGTTWQQLKGSGAPPPRAFASLAYDEDSQLLVLFGGNGGGIQGGLRTLVPNDTWVLP
jgi:hypothetical protein